jgi:DNA-binding transcriptional LysR family regulator
MFRGFELRRIPYALALAQELNFGRAALRLHVAQPSMTNQIRQLEDEIDVQLFERTSQHVKLTPAGRRFMKEAKLAILHSERAIEQAKSADRKSEPLVIAYSPHINFDLLCAVRYASSAPSRTFELKLASIHTYEQIEAIAEGTIHAGLLTLPIKNESIATKVLLREPLSVFLPDSHRFAPKTELKARELNGEPVISLRRHLDCVFHDHLDMLFKKQGYTPRLVQEVTTMAEALYMVAHGIGITFGTASTIAHRQAGVVAVKLHEPTLVEETGIAYRRSNRSEQIVSFVGAMRRSAEGIVRRLAESNEPLPEDSRQLKLF